MGLIYLATNTLNNKVYIGQTIQTLSWRIKRHYDTAKQNRAKGKKEQYFGKALLKYDKSIFEWDVLEDNITGKDALNEAEIFWIAYYKYIGAELYNLTNGGEGASGHKVTLEVRKQIAAALRGKLRPEHVKAKISAKRKTKVISEETKRKMSESAKGKVRSAKTYTLLSPDGKLVTITNMLAFCRVNGLEDGNMCQVANGKRKSHRGWTKPEHKR